MLKFSACVEMMYRDLPLLERFEPAARTGVSACEIWRFAQHDLNDIKTAIEKSGIPLSSMCIGTKDEALAEEYAQKALLSADSGDALYKICRESAEAAKFLGVSNLIITTGQERNDITRAEQHANIVLALRQAAPILEEYGVMAVLEPLNVIRNHKGYFLSSAYEAFAIIREVGSPNVKLLYDIYHQQITDGNLIENITKNIDLIGHFHVADVPGRHEPGTGEINYPAVFKAISDSGYDRFVGLEFAPTGDSGDALKQVLAMA